MVKKDNNLYFGLTPGVTTSHELMKYMENDEYFILFMRHFPCPSPMEFIHQHPIKWIHQCIFTSRDDTWHWSWGEIDLYPSHKINFDIIFFCFLSYLYWTCMVLIIRLTSKFIFLTYFSFAYRHTYLMFLFTQQRHLLLYFKVFKICDYFHTGQYGWMTYVKWFISFMIYEWYYIS